MSDVFLTDVSVCLVLTLFGACYRTVASPVVEVDDDELPIGNVRSAKPGWRWDDESSVQSGCDCCEQPCVVGSSESDDDHFDVWAVLKAMPPPFAVPVVDERGYYVTKDGQRLCSKCRAPTESRDFSVCRRCYSDVTGRAGIRAKHRVCPGCNGPLYGPSPLCFDCQVKRRLFR